MVVKTDMGEKKMDIGLKIKSYRKQSGFTQEELAKKAFISRSYLADVERNRYNPSLETLDKIISALNITKLEFYKDETDIHNNDCFTEEDIALLNKIKSLSKEDSKKIQDIINIFEKENK